MHISPTILGTRNLRVVVYPKDHSPPHFHVLGPDQEAKFGLDAVDCFYSRGFSEKALGQIKEYLKSKKKALLEAWHEYEE